VGRVGAANSDGLRETGSSPLRSRIRSAGTNIRPSDEHRDVDCDPEFSSEGTVAVSQRCKPGGEGGIRTPGTVLPVQRFSKAPLSTTQPPLRTGLGRQTLQNESARRISDFCGVFEGGQSCLGETSAGVGEGVDVHSLLSFRAERRIQCDVRWRKGGHALDCSLRSEWQGKFDSVHLERATTVRVYRPLVTRTDSIVRPPPARKVDLESCLLSSRRPADARALRGTR
jgi:hypothetical protein